MRRDATDKRVLNYCEEVLLFNSDVALLNARNWLNDQIISFALEYIYRETLRPLQQAEVTNFLQLVFTGILYVGGDSGSV